MTEPEIYDGTISVLEFFLGIFIRYGKRYDYVSLISLSEEAAGMPEQKTMKGKKSA